MIIAKNLTKIFDDFTAVRDVSLNIAAGEVLALLGPNGAGKTTTIRMLTSVLRPTLGTALIGGYDVVKEPSKVRSIVGVLTEHHGLYNRMHAIEYLEFFGEIYGMSKKERRLQAEQMLDDFGLNDAVDRRIGQFSKGMRQKLALSRALIHKPKVLLLDEPTSAMDPASARLVRDAISTLRSKDRAIIICTHNLVEAEELADRIAIIRRGKIIANGTPQELKLKMLGPRKYEVTFGNDINRKKPELPAGVEITEHGKNWLRFFADNPAEVNPKVTNALVKQGYQIISIQEVTRSLEQVYLQVVATNDETEKEANMKGRYAS